MKKSNGRCILVKGDMFADGLIILQPIADVDLYEKLVRKLVKIDDAQMKEWRDIYIENCKCKGFVAVKDSDNDGRWQLVVFTSAPEWKATLAHEAVHAAERMCEHRHIPISKDTEELRAMLVGKIVQKTLASLNEA